MNMHLSQQPVINSDTTTVKQAKSHESIWGEDGFTFGDVLDMINPLQHLPMVSKIYRQQTHDDASEGSKLIGGMLLGGLLGGITGVVTSIANTTLKHETHKNISEHALALFDKSLNDRTSGTSTGVSDSSLKKLFVASEIIKGSKPQDMGGQNEAINPFFAELFDESLYSAYQEQGSSKRSHDWGKV